MIVAAIAPPAIYRPASDRALGDAGRALKQSLTAAFYEKDAEDRASEMYQRVSAALRKAAADDGTLMSPDTVSRTLEFLATVPANVPLPEVVVESENEIGLDWDEARNRVVSLTINDGPMIGFSAFFGAEPIYGRMAFVGALPKTFRFLSDRLYPR